MYLLVSARFQNRSLHCFDVGVYIFFVQLGGAPDIVNFTGNRFTQGFSGCIHIVEGSEGHSINLRHNAISGLNVDTCPQ